MATAGRDVSPPSRARPVLRQKGAEDEMCYAGVKSRLSLTSLCKSRIQTTEPSCPQQGCLDCGRNVDEAVYISYLRALSGEQTAARAG